jgi:hypothetical protein
MTIAGSILGLFFSTIGGLLLVISFWAEVSGNKTGALLVSILALMMLTLQAIFSIVGFFKARAAGIGLVSSALFVGILAVLTKGHITVLFEILILGSGILCIAGSRKSN